MIKTKNDELMQIVKWLQLNKLSLTILEAHFIKKI